MRRWFLVMAVVVLTLWGAALVALVRDQPAPNVAAWSDRAAGATLALHLGGVSWLAWPRTTVSWPGWVRVQARKHRRKGVWFAAWGISAAGLAWLAVRGVPRDAGTSGHLVWFGVTGNLGFQPGLLVAEALALGSRGRLDRLGGTSPLPGPIVEREV